MKKRNILLLILPFLLMVSCSTPIDTTNSGNNSGEQSGGNTEGGGTQGGGNTEGGNTEGGGTQGGGNTEGGGTEGGGTQGGGNTEGGGTQGGGNTEGGNTETDSFERKLLDCGYYQTYLPKNHSNPMTLTTTLSADNSTWSNNEMLEYMPTNFRYIYRNSCDDGPTGEKSSPGFYSYDSTKTKSYPGGLKITRTGEGFQSPEFVHTGAKIELRIGITQVNNSNKTAEEDKDTIKIYFFNKNGTLLGTCATAEKTIKTSTTELKYYYTENNAKDVAYFEFRLNDYPYQGSQAYNIGLGYCNFKSWERA